MRVEVGAGRAAVVAALAFVAALQVHRLDDPDTWWHLAAGREIARAGAVPETDPFSYTAPGAPWLNRQWLFEAAIYGSWRLLGDTGPIAFAGATFLVAFGLVAAIGARHLPAWATALLVWAAAAAAVERFTVRPEAVTLAALALYLLLLERRTTWRIVPVFVGVQVLWANAHALSVLGLLPVGARLVEAVWSPWRGRVDGAATPAERGPLLVAMVGMMLAEACTPFGIQGALYPLYLLRLIGGEEFLSHTIVEHRATSLAVLSPVAALALVALGVAALLAITASARRLSLRRLLVAVAVVVLAAMARRNVALAGIGLAPLVAAGLGPALAAAEGRVRARARAIPAALALAVAVWLVAQAASVVHGGFYQDARLTRAFGLGTSLLLYPRGAVEFLAREGAGRRVFNDDLLGGFLLWEHGGATRVFFDGRLQVYPPAIYREYQAVLEDVRTFPALAAKWDVGAVLLHHPSPGRLEAAAGIARLPGWRIAYLDAGGIVLFADGGTGEPAGIRDRVVAAATPGIADGFEALVAPLRGGWEEATAWYQRGRALHFLYGPPGYRLARRDFEEALRCRSDFAPARIGLAAAAEPR